MQSTVPMHLAQRSARKLMLVCSFLASLCFSVPCLTAKEANIPVPQAIVFCGTEFERVSITDVTASSGTFKKDHLPGRMTRYYYQPKVKQSPQSYLVVFLLTEVRSITDAYKATMEVVSPSIWPHANVMPIDSTIIYHDQFAAQASSQAIRFYLGDLMTSDFGYKHRGHLSYIVKLTEVGAMGILFAVDCGKNPPDLQTLRAEGDFKKRSEALIQLWPSPEKLPGA